MDANLLFRRARIIESKEDVEDLALSFMENEVGRHDWKNNWKVVKQRGNVYERIKDWLNLMNAQTDPQAVIDHLDAVSKERTGRWL